MSCEGYYLECQCNECINRETPSSAKDARIAELTADLKVADRAALELAAEVARYKAALEEIVDPESFGWDSSKLPDAAWLARNALKEGV